MSRSRKKFPRVPLGDNVSPAQQFFRRRARIKVRRTGIEDLPNGSHYKRIDDCWGWPSDGHGCIEKNAKGYRK